jgi:hypothetical protein
MENKNENAHFSSNIVNGSLMDENLVVLQLVIVVLATRAKNIFIYNTLMIKTYVAFLELQYFLYNQLNQCLIICWYFVY